MLPLLVIYYFGGSGGSEGAFDQFVSSFKLQ